MANLKKQPSNKPLQNAHLHRQTPIQKQSLLAQLNTFLNSVFFTRNCTNPHLVVAFSGGLDSSVLLHLMAQLRQSISFQLSAHHVHHGLSQHADAWADF